MSQPDFSVLTGTYFQLNGLIKDHSLEQEMKNTQR